MRPILKLVVHCSASPDAMDIGFIEIDEWHEKRGWKSPSGVHCGYHFIIRRNGVIEMGRFVNEIGAHVQGANSDSLGICLVGTHEFEEIQFKRLRSLLANLMGQYPHAMVYGHAEFESAKLQKKTCPNFDIHELMKKEMV